MEPKDHDTKASNESQPEQGGGSKPMMMDMMKKMMTQMGSGGESPMAMIQKMMGQMGQVKPGADGEPPMQHMMDMCMSMCAEMLTTMQQTTAMATFATPELRELFAEWLDSVAVKALAALNEKGIWMRHSWLKPWTSVPMARSISPRWHGRAKSPFGRRHPQRNERGTKAKGFESGRNLVPASDPNTELALHCSELRFP